MPTLAATPIVEVGFAAGASTGTDLTLDDTARGLLDTGTLAGDDPWVDVTGWVRQFTCRRGASRVQGPAFQADPGTATIVLNNADGRFDPTNLDGPYVLGGTITQVTPMRPVRIRAEYDGQIYDLWRGNADQWDVEWQDPRWSTCTLTATDATKVLAACDRVAGGAVGAGEHTGTRVNRILDSASWPATERAVDTGDSTLQATTLGGSALDELQLAVKSELGELQVDAAGRVEFRHRLGVLADPRSATSQATFGDVPGELRYADLKLSNDDTQLCNKAMITREGGTQQIAQDAQSIIDYLVHTASDTGLLLQTDGDAAQYAAFLVVMGKQPELRFDALTVTCQRDPASLYPQALGRRLGDRVTVNRRPPHGGTVTRDVFLRGVTHEVTPQRWKTTWVLQSATRYQFLVLDDPVLGRLDTNPLAY